MAVETHVRCRISWTLHLVDSDVLDIINIDINAGIVSEIDTITNVLNMHLPIKSKY